METQVEKILIIRKEQSLPSSPYSSLWLNERKTKQEGKRHFILTKTSSFVAFDCEC